MSIDFPHKNENLIKNCNKTDAKWHLECLEWTRKKITAFLWLKAHVMYLVLLATDRVPEIRFSGTQNQP